MSTYKFKVLKGGKVYGEATTKAEAEAVAKKIGGSVAEVVGAKPATRKPAAKKSKPARRLANPSVRSGNYFGQTEGGDLFAATTLENLRKKADKLRRQGEVVESTAFKQIGSGMDGYAQAIPNALAKPVANPKNPPLEPVPAAVLLDTVRAGVPQTFHGVKVELQPVVDGKPMQRWQALAAIEAGKEGKKVNPKAKPAAKPKAKNPERSDYLPENRVTLTLKNGDKLTFMIYGKESDIRAFNMGASYDQHGEVYRKGDRRGSDVVAVDVVQTRAPLVSNPNPKTVKPKTVKAKVAPKTKTPAKPKKPATRKPAKTAAKVAYI